MNKDLQFAMITLFVCIVTGLACGQASTAPKTPGAKASAKAATELVLAKGSCYKMGDTFGDGAANERPVHDVCVKDFYIGKYLVTKSEWAKVMGSAPANSSPCGNDCPVDSVSWNDVQKYLGVLNQRTGRHYRLPSEAEWEYAARSGGKNEKWSGTSDPNALLGYAWVFPNSKFQLHSVGLKKPNGLGLYDMTGDAWEWTSDWYDIGYYASSPEDNPQGPASGTLRSARGGFWGDVPRLARASRRIGLRPDTRIKAYGFRIARSAP